MKNLKLSQVVVSLSLAVLGACSAANGPTLPPGDSDSLGSAPVVRPPGYVPPAPLPDVLPDNVIPFRAARGK